MNYIFGQPISPLTHPYVDIFLLGFVAATSLSVALFFLRFWWGTRDVLFLAFVVFFVVQGCGDIFVLTLRHPNLGNPWLFLVRLLSVLGVLAAILVKNFSRN